MSLGVGYLVFPALERSPSHSFTLDNEGRCSAIASFLSGKLSLPPIRENSLMSSAKVTPYPNVEAPLRLVRSRAVRRDEVSEWNFDEN